jgi:hypothetical protein
MQGSISPTCLRAAFKTLIPKAQNDCLFALFGSTQVKATCKMLVKSTPDGMQHSSVIFVSYQHRLKDGSEQNNSSVPFHKWEVGRHLMRSRNGVKD